MSGSNILAKKETLERSINLGWVFAYTIFEINNEMIEDPAVVEAKVIASGALTQEEKDYLVNDLIPKYTVLNVQDAHAFITSYYSNIYLLFSEFALLAKIASTQVAPTPNLNTLVNQYSDESGKYLMADEDEYKLHAEFYRLYLPAEAELASSVDALNVV